MAQFTIDEKTGAVLVSQSKEEQKLAYCYKEINKLKKENAQLKSRLTKIENKLKEEKGS